MGQVLQAGAGQIASRQAAVNAGIPMTVPATTINKVCLSGVNSIRLADQMIQAGEADIVVAGRAEEHTSELQSLMRSSYADFWLNKRTEHRTRSKPTYNHPDTHAQNHIYYTAR